jgi:beta-lactamase superfamily II metal-dependent hydrolase
VVASLRPLLIDVGQGDSILLVTPEGRTKKGGGRAKKQPTDIGSRQEKTPDDHTA